MGKDNLDHFLDMLKNNISTFKKIDKSQYFGKKYPQFDLIKYFSNHSDLENFKRIIINFQNSFQTV